MARFVFRLQSFLNLKEQLEKNVKNELGVANQKLQQEKIKLRRIKEDIDTYSDKFRSACTGSIEPEKIKELKIYLEHLYNNEQKQKLNVKREQQNVDKIREKLISIMRDKKVLENLREKNFQEFLSELEKGEQLLADELVSYKEATREKA
ncbi:MAG: flagellar export protein FliJ [Clostridiaceae bacterium]|nr:flagellar export protein FliJ [Clostridiaceae bacterium]